MPFGNKQGIKYFYFDNLYNGGVIHAVFTRQGGVSPSPWNSLNLGSTVGDESGNVDENKRRALRAMGVKPETVYDVWQVHSNKIVITNAPRAISQPHQKADGILTTEPGVTLLMRFADCVPILIHDPANKVVGIVHAGWQGTVKKIAAKLVERMVDVYGTCPKDLLVGIGPSIGPQSYEVGTDVIKKVYDAFGDAADSLLIKYNNETVHFDLWHANEKLFRDSGVENIEVAGICTASNIRDWFSHRAEQGRTGRFGAMIKLVA